MVLVEDISDTSSNTSQHQSPSSESSTNQRSGTSGPSASSSSSTATPNSSPNIFTFLMQDKISAVLLFTRAYSIICTIMFIVPIFGFDPNVLYQKALMSSAATSALKLHQRMLNVPLQLNREYLAKLVVEDSFHYLVYSLIFLNSSPITIVLMPIAAFALLHVCAYVKTLLGKMGIPESSVLVRKGINVVLVRDKEIMRFVALCEIMLVPTIFVMIFTGKSGLFIPFIYYRFLCMRYSSRRNPYNRLMFYEIRVSVENYTNQASCPQMVRNMSQRLINLCARFAPPQQ